MVVEDTSANDADDMAKAMAASMQSGGEDDGALQGTTTPPLHRPAAHRPRHPATSTVLPPCPYGIRRPHHLDLLHLPPFNDPPSTLTQSFNELSPHQK